MSMDIKLGCDPETFVTDGKEFFAAYGMLPGTKSEPFEVDKGAVQVDGLAFEFNIKPATTEDEFETNISTVLKQMDEMVKKVDKSFKLAFLPVAHFNRKYFSSLPEDAKILGCDPDYSSVGAQQHPKTFLTETPMRTASGHIHIGWTEDMKPHHQDHFLECMKVTSHFRNEEFFKPKTLLEKIRYQYYGYNGAFRPKSYGIELRAPSNRWVKEEETRRRMFRNVTERFKSFKR